MTSGNDDKKGPPAPRRPAPPAPARPSGPTSGGAAARPPSTVPNAARPNPAARPAPAPGRPPRPPDDLDADAKTTAFNIADMGLDDDESTVSVEAEALKAKVPPPRAAAPAQAPARAAPAPAPAPRAAAPRAPEPEPDEERTTAFNIADLPPEDEVRPNPSTLVSSKPGAAVRGGAAPAKRNETLALAPSAARAAVQQAHQRSAPAAEPHEDKTVALSMDDVEKIEAMKAARIASKAAAAAGAPAPKPAAAAKMPAHIDEGERTMAVSLDDAIAAVDSSPPKKPSVVKSSQAAQAPAAKAARPVPVADQNEKTTAMSLDDIDAIDALPARKPSAELAKKPPAKATPAKASPARAGAKFDLGASEGFVGAIGYAFKHDALEAKSAAGLDPARETAGLRNLIFVGGGLAALMLLFGIIW